MRRTRVLAIVLGCAIPWAVQAQLVVKDDRPPDAPNPADKVDYPPRGYLGCNTSIADVGARAVLRAIDQCPVTFFESREAYLRYAGQALAALAVPGLSEVALAQAINKARANAFECLFGSLIEASGASAEDKAFMSALVAELKELEDRRELATSLAKLRTTLAETGGAQFLEDEQARAFLLSVDEKVADRIKALGTESALVAAGRARNQTAESRARDALERVDQLSNECDFEAAIAAAERAQAANLEWLGELRFDVQRKRKDLECIQRQVGFRDGVPPLFVESYVARALDGAQADIRAATERDEAQTRVSQELANRIVSYRARRGDVEALRNLAIRFLERAGAAANACEFDAAERELAAMQVQTLECGTKLDDVRQRRTEFLTAIDGMRRQLTDVETEYAKAIAVQPGDPRCGDIGTFASYLDQFQGRCRTIAQIDAKVAALRQRSRECADARTAAAVAAVPTAQGLGKLPVEVKPSARNPFGPDASQYDDYAFGESSSTMTLVRNDRNVTVTWTWNGVPASLEPDQAYTIGISGSMTKSSAQYGTNFSTGALTADMSFTGLVVVAEQRAAVGDLSSGYAAKGSGSYTVKLAPGADRASITLHADYGFGDTAVHRYEKRSR